VRLLIAKGGAAILNMQELQHGYSSLHLALNSSQQPAELVSLLLQSGVDVNAKTNNKVTPLMLAQELPVVRLLLSAGAAVNAKSSVGTTALHSAAERGLSAAVVCCLLKAGADATAVNIKGYDATAVAVKHGHTATAALLQRTTAAAASAAATTAAPVTAAAPTPVTAAAAALIAAETATATSPVAAALTTAAVAGMSNDAASRAATGTGSKITTAASANSAAGANAGAVKGNTAKPDAAVAAAAGAAAVVAAAAASEAKATATWVCMHCDHIDNPMEDTTCQACGAVGNTEQQRRVFEAVLPELMARGPDITLPDSFFDDMPDEAAAKAKSVALVPRSLRKTSRSRTIRGTISSSSAAARARLTTLISASASKAAQSLQTAATAPVAASVAADTAVVSSRSKPVGGSWHCAERDLPVRNRYLSKIAQVLASSTKARLCGSTRYNSVLPTAARHLEAELYDSAASLAVYSDDSTWQLRMCEIAESDFDGEVAVAWRAADPYCQQREQAAIAALAAAAIAPTPLECISTELLGGSWRSDAHDMLQRSQLVNRVAHAFLNTPPALVLELARELEATLYSSAPSLQSYIDESTCMSRIQHAIEINQKRRAASGASCCITARVESAASAAHTLPRGLASNWAKPILLKAAVAPAAAPAETAATAAMTGTATATSSVDGTTASHCASAAASATCEVAANTLSCTTAVTGSSASAAASTAVVAESHAIEAELVAGAAEALQPQSSEQRQYAVKCEQIDTDSTQAVSTALVGSTSTTVMVPTAAAHKHAHSTTTTFRDGTSSANSKSSNVDDVKPEAAAALLQQHHHQRLLAAESRVEAAAKTVAATSAAATAALCQVLAQQILSDTHAVLAAITAAAAAADSASAALKEQVAALQELHVAQLEAQQQCMSSNVEVTVAADCVDVVDTVESESDDDCPPLAYASELHSTTGILSDTAAVSAPIATVTARQ
jgi:trimeric autotransporter adhesin